MFCLLLFPFLTGIETRSNWRLRFEFIRHTFAPYYCVVVNSGSIYSILTVYASSSRLDLNILLQTLLFNYVVSSNHSGKLSSINDFVSLVIHYSDSRMISSTESSTQLYLGTRRKATKAMAQWSKILEWFWDLIYTVFDTGLVTDSRSYPQPLRTVAFVWPLLGTWSIRHIESAQMTQGECCNNNNHQSLCLFNYFKRKYTNDWFIYIYKKIMNCYWLLYQIKIVF